MRRIINTNEEVEGIKLIPISEIMRILQLK